MDPFHGLSGSEWRKVIRRATTRFEREHGPCSGEGLQEAYLHEAANEVRAERHSRRSASLLVGAWLLCAGVMYATLWVTSTRHVEPATAICDGSARYSEPTAQPPAGSEMFLNASRIPFDGSAELRQPNVSCPPPVLSLDEYRTRITLIERQGAAPEDRHPGVR